VKIRRRHALDRIWEYPGWAIASNGMLVLAMVAEATSGPRAALTPLYLPAVFFAGFWGGVGPGLAMALAALLVHGLLGLLIPTDLSSDLFGDLLFLGLALGAGSLGAALRREYQRQSRAAEMGRTLLRFARAAGDPTQRPFLMKALVDAGPRLVGCDYGAACVLREGLGNGGTGARFVPEQQTTGAALPLSELNFPVSQEPLSRLLAERTPVLITNETREGKAVLAAARLRPLRRALWVPAESWGRVVGCLVFGDTASARPFTEEEREVAGALAAQMAVAVEGAAAFDALLDQAAESSRLLQLSSALNSRLELGAILREAAEGAAAIAQAGAAAVGLVTGDQVTFREQWQAGQWRSAPKVLALSEVVAAAEGRTASASACLTLLIRDPHGDPLGALELYDRRRSLTASNEHLLRVFAIQAAIAIQNGRLYDSLRRQHSRLQELEKLREDLTHMIVHDLRTPLTGLLGALQTIDQGVLGEPPAPIAELNRIALRSARALLGMVNDLLDINKLESGSLRPECTSVAVKVLVAAALEQVSPLLQDRGLVLEQDLPADLPNVTADADLIERVLVNLLGNAVKFTPRGGRITIAATSQADQVAIRVTDTGEGIPPEYHQTIFEKFGQVANKRSSQMRSTGLGLTFCKMAVEAHGGRIGVESAPGAGSTFAFTLPIAPAVPCVVRIA
jgi:signal transduction histidine kinase